MALGKGVNVDLFHGDFSGNLFRLSGAQVDQHVVEGIGVIVFLELLCGGEDNVRQLNGQFIGRLLGVGRCIAQAWLPFSER